MRQYPHVSDSSQAEQPKRPSHRGAEIRVGTFNLLHGRSLRDGSTDAEALRSAVTALDADVLGLQEVDRHQPRSGHVDQTALVADAMVAVHHRFVPALNGTPGFDWEPADGDGSEPDDDSVRPSYGIGLVSRLPVIRWDVLRFPAAKGRLPLLVPAEPKPQVVRVPDEPRSVLAAVVATEAGPMTVATAHLSFVPVVNARQLRAARRWLAGWPRPLVLMGDFNLPGALPAWLTGLNQLARTPTYPSWSARIQFDHVMAEGLTLAQVRRVRSMQLAVSDHCGLTVDLALD
jgi:endonuclease/exonuclease/phosphatase family metal-dependent hydrolase